MAEQPDHASWSVAAVPVLLAKEALAKEGLAKEVLAKEVLAKEVLAPAAEGAM